MSDPKETPETERDALERADFFKGAEDMVQADDAQLKICMAELIELDAEIEALKDNLADLNTRHSELRSKHLPALMIEQGTDVWRDPATGYGVQLEHAVNASLPRDPDKRTEILDHLKPLGVDEITNDTLEFRFMKGDNRPALLQGYAEEHDLPYTRMVGVHSTRFKSWLKEKIEQGMGAEITEAGIWHGKAARLVKPRKGKK